MTLAEKTAAVESTVSALKAAVAALGTSGGASDEALQEGEALVHQSEQRVYAMTGGRMVTLVLRGAMGS